MGVCVTEQVTHSVLHDVSWRSTISWCPSNCARTPTQAKTAKPPNPQQKSTPKAETQTNPTKIAWNRFRLRASVRPCRGSSTKQAPQHQGKSKRPMPQKEKNLRSRGLLNVHGVSDQRGFSRTSLIERKGSCPAFSFILDTNPWKPAAGCRDPTET